MYVLCVLEQLHGALHRRDMFAVQSGRWADPRALELRLLVALLNSADFEFHPRLFPGECQFPKPSAGMCRVPCTAVRSFYRIYLVFRV